MANSSLYHHMLVLVLLCIRPIASQVAKCDVRRYGKPLGSDCATLFQKFTETQMLQSRFFDEEQLRAEPDYSWPGIDNPFVPSVVQVPKYYSMSQLVLNPVFHFYKPGHGSRII